MRKLWHLRSPILGYNHKDQDPRSDSPAPSIGYDHEEEAPFIDQPRQKFQIQKLTQARSLEYLEKAVEAGVVLLNTLKAQDSLGLEEEIRNLNTEAEIHYNEIGKLQKQIKDSTDR